MRADAAVDARAPELLELLLAYMPSRQSLPLCTHLYTPLLVACKALDRATDDEQAVILRMASALIEYDQNAIDVMDKKGWTPLQTTAEFGSLIVTNLLIDHDADVNLADKKGLTPLRALRRARPRGARLIHSPLVRHLPPAVVLPMSLTSVCPPWRPQTGRCRRASPLLLISCSHCSMRALTRR